MPPFQPPWSAAPAPSITVFGIVRSVYARNIAMPDLATRFQSRNEHLFHFTDRFFVRCPRCDECASVLLHPPDTKLDWFAPRIVTCSHCGFLREWSENGISWRHAAAEDPYFHLPLWLQIECCGKTLWAYNTRHLDYLEAYVAARLRERVRRDGHSRNSTITSRLPKWLIASHNRKAVLQAIEKIRRTALTHHTSHESNQAV